MSVTAQRVSIVVDEVAKGRVDPTRGAITRFVEKAFTLPEHERLRIVDGVMSSAGPIRTRLQEERPSMTSEPKNVLRGQDLIRTAAQVFRANPEFTARETYQHITSVLELRIAMSFVSFQNGFATRARRLAASDEPIESVDLKEAPKKKPRPKPKAAGARKKASAARAPATVKSAAVVPPAPPADPIDAESVDGTIGLHFGDQYLEGRLVDGTWHLHVVVPDSKIDDFVNLIWKRGVEAA